jgi:hypothetical protein
VHDDIAPSYRPNGPERVRELATLQRWYAAQVAYFIEGLKAMPEGALTRSCGEPRRRHGAEKP